MRHQCYVTCGQCGKDGPAAEFAPAARQKALDAGWSVGKRAGQHKPGNYCPDCAAAVRLPRCQGTSVPCPVTAMYEIITPDGSKFYGCGRHYGFLLLAAFRANPGRKLTMGWLRSPMRGGTFEAQE